MRTAGQRRQATIATTAAIETLPATLRTGVAHWLDRLNETLDAELPVGELPALLRFVACSEYGANMLLRYWPDVRDYLADFNAPPDSASLQAFANEIAQSDASPDDVMQALRRQRNLRLLHVLWRELAGVATLEDTLLALSETAEQLLQAAAGYAQRNLMERFGVIRDSSGESVSLLIIGMGKLGGGELNFSSDIDIIFAYPADGKSDGRKSLHAQEYFDRLSRHIVRLMDERTADGFVFRTDTRLRPFGDSGPPVVSLAALESYLVQHGRDWERYAYVKARLVGEPAPAAVAADLFNNLIVPFVYRRYLDYGVFESLREMYSLIANEVQRQDLADNVKLGPGGIREIEFIVQSFQLLRGGNKAELRDPSLLAVLPRLIDSRAISDVAAQALEAAYRFLRRLENFLQALRDQQTHELPTDGIDRARLAFAMGFADWQQLIKALNGHRANVTAQFDEVALRRKQMDKDDTAAQRISKLWDADASEGDLVEGLRDAGFADPEEVARDIAAFRNSPAARMMDARARERLHEFMPRLLLLARQKQRPAVAVQRSLTVIERILRRSAYIALLNENQLAAERLVGLCERSAYIAAEIARFPVLLDELLDPRLISVPINKTELCEELAARLNGVDPLDSEARMDALAQFQRAIMFRVAIADFNGSLPTMKVSDSLTFLAETVIDEALTTAWRDLVARHGVPTCEDGGKRREAGFGVIAYGKLGGLELSYGSDLDIVFLHDSKGDAQTTDGDKPLDNAMFFLRLVRRLVHFLTTHTNSGVLYEIDTRLRPSGRKGMLVTSTDAFERYQEENAWTWEHQALLRARAVAGSAAVGEEFERIRTETLMQRVRLDMLRDDVLDMRARMRAELDRSDADRFDLKQGRGGIGDIEFLVQYLVLREAASEPSLIEYSDNIRQLDALVACGAVAADIAGLLQDVYRAYRLRQHHLVLNDEPAVVPAAEFSTEREQVCHAWDRYFEA